MLQTSKALGRCFLPGDLGRRLGTQLECARTHTHTHTRTLVTLWTPAHLVHTISNSYALSPTGLTFQSLFNASVNPHSLISFGRSSQKAQFAIMTQHSFWQQEIAHVTYAISCDLHVAAIALISWGLTASFDRLLLSSSMSWKGTLICAIFLLLSLPARAVDRGNFKTCDQSSFCRCALTRACFSTSGLAPRSARICPLLKSNSHQFAPVCTNLH